jgi:GTP-binding protein EngB required for normal cell division
VNNALSTIAPPPNTCGSRETNQAGVLAATLKRAEALLEAALEPGSPLIARLRLLDSRLANEHLQVAVVGQFKRGKSTFINALLGDNVLPTGVIPLTAVATFIAWGEEPLVVVHFRDQAPREEFALESADGIREILFRFVSEKANPENRLGVGRVDLFYPSDILAGGTVIIDTPGFGSTMRHNTEAALQVLPECDAAFFVVSADPPITEVEVEYLHRLKPKAARIFFILNKVDYLRQDEKDIMVDFMRNVLTEKHLLEPDGRVFGVSARKGLEAKRSGNLAALETSGMAELENHIFRALAGEKTRWLEDGVRSKTIDVLEQAAADLQLRVRALNMPIEELIAKSHAFQEALRSIEDQRRTIRDLLAGDHRRLRDALDSRTGRLRKEIAQRLAVTIDATLLRVTPQTWEQEARRSLSQSIHIEFDNARLALVNAFVAEATAALAQCKGRVNDLIGHVRRTAAELFDVPVGPDTDQENFALGESPYWLTEDMQATLIPNPSWLIDRLLPRSLRRSRVRSRMMAQAQELIIRNAENLRWAIMRGMDDLLRTATAQLEERLDEAIKATRDVIKDALARRQDQSFAVKSEIERFSTGIGVVASLVEELQSQGRADMSA